MGTSSIWQITDLGTSWGQPYSVWTTTSSLSFIIPTESLETENINSLNFVLGIWFDSLFEAVSFGIDLKYLEEIEKYTLLNVALLVITDKHNQLMTSRPDLQSACYRWEAETSRRLAYCIRRWHVSAPLVFIRRCLFSNFPYTLKAHSALATWRRRLLRSLSSTILRTFCLRTIRHRNHRRSARDRFLTDAGSLWRSAISDKRIPPRYVLLYTESPLNSTEATTAPTKAPFFALSCALRVHCTLTKRRQRMPPRLFPTLPCTIGNKTQHTTRVGPLRFLLPDQLTLYWCIARISYAFHSVEIQPALWCPRQQTAPQMPTVVCLLLDVNLRYLDSMNVPFYLMT